MSSTFPSPLVLIARFPVLLSGRIIWSNYKVKQYHAGARWSVLEAVVQSAALYSAALISLLTTYVAGSNAQYVCLDALQPIIISARLLPSSRKVPLIPHLVLRASQGITFTLIIIRVGLGETSSENSNLKAHRLPVDAAGAPPLASLQSHGQPYPLRTLAVNVSVSRTYDRASFDVYEQKDASDSGVHGTVTDVESGQGGP